MTSCLLSWKMKSQKNGSTLEEKNLLLGEQILFFKSRPHLEGRENQNSRVASTPFTKI